MSLTKEQIAERKAAREAKLVEHRTAEATESIADSLEEIRAQIVSLNHHMGTLVRTLGSIGAKIR